MTLSQRITGFKKLDFDYWYFFFLVLAFGEGTAIVSTFDPRSQPLSFIVLIIATFILHRQTEDKSEYSKIFKVSNLIYLLWAGYHYFADSFGFEYGSYIMNSIYMNIGIIVAVHYKKYIFDYYVRIVVTLTVFGLIFWLIGSVVGYTTMLQLAPLEHKWGTGGSYLVYVITTGFNKDVSLQDDSLMYGPFLRNCGFCWEPGRFACLIIMALAANMVKNNKFSWISSRNLILIVGLISTFSTTGFVTLIVTLFFYYLFSNKVSFVNKIVVVIILCIAVSYIMTLPFMQEKIIKDADSDSWVTNKSSSWVENEDEIFTVGRTEGLALDFLNLQEKPIGGCGLSHKGTYVYSNISTNITSSNGLLNPLSKLGLLVGLLYIVAFAIGCRFLSESQVTKKNTTMLFFITFMVASYSYNFFFEIFAFSVAFSGFTTKKK